MPSTEDVGRVEALRRQAEPEPASAVPAGEEFASVPRRLAAWVIDVVGVVALIMIGVSVAAAVFGPTVRVRPGTTPPVTVGEGRVALNALVSASLSAAYFVIPWVALGASPGQLLLRMQVRGETDGGTLTPRRAIARWILLFPQTAAALTVGAPSLAALVWGSALVWYLILALTTARSASKQGLHDRIVRSVVRPRSA